MAYIIPTSDMSGDGPLINLGTLDSAFIGMGLSIEAISGTAISGSGNNHSVYVNGHVVGTAYGISLGASSNSTGEFVRIGTTGSVSSTSTGILIYGDNSRIENSGDVFGHLFGINIANNGPLYSTIENSGYIVGRVAGIVRNAFSDAGEVRLTNTGTIIGISSYLGSNYKDKIINKGEMIGNIELAGGWDRYDGLHGTVKGSVFGGSGNDVFIAGKTKDVFDGGSGTDVVEFRYAGKVQVALDGTLVNKGAAAGDVYTNIENIVGSSSGYDRLRGDSKANSLRGLGGMDSLLGAAGNDTLNGGGQKDSLTGGSGNDAFVFEKRSHAGDVIADFGGSVGNDDVIKIKASGFGGGLTAGVLADSQFRTLSNNVALDADDRFILRTGDKTLWFDVDGSGATAAFMVADLSANAVLHADDIIIF